MPLEGMFTSAYRGVCWNKKTNKWQAALNHLGQYVYIGCFDGEGAAAEAFDKAAIRIRGAAARLNFEMRRYQDSDGKLLPDPEMDALLEDAFSRRNKPYGNKAKAENRQYKRMRKHCNLTLPLTTQSTPSTAQHTAELSPGTEAAQTLAGLKSADAISKHRHSAVGEGCDPTDRIPEMYVTDKQEKVISADGQELVGAYPNPNPNPHAAVPVATTTTTATALSNNHKLHGDAIMPTMPSNAHAAQGTGWTPPAVVKAFLSDTTLGKRASPHADVSFRNVVPQSAGDHLECNPERLSLQSSDSINCSMQAIANGQCMVTGKQQVQPVHLFRQGSSSTLTAFPACGSPDKRVEAPTVQCMSYTRMPVCSAAAMDQEMHEARKQDDQLWKQDQAVAWRVQTHVTPSVQTQQQNNRVQSMPCQQQQQQQQVFVYLQNRPTSAPVTPQSTADMGNVAVQDRQVSDRIWQRAADLDIALRMFPVAPGALPRSWVMDSANGTTAHAPGSAALATSAAHAGAVPFRSDFCARSRSIEVPPDFMATPVDVPMQQAGMVARPPPQQSPATQHMDLESAVANARMPYRRVLNPDGGSIRFVGDGAYPTSPASSHTNHMQGVPREFMVYPESARASVLQMAAGSPGPHDVFQMATGSSGPHDVYRQLQGTRQTASPFMQHAPANMQPDQLRPRAPPEAQAMFCGMPDSTVSSAMPRLSASSQCELNGCDGVAVDNVWDRRVIHTPHGSYLQIVKRIPISLS